MLRVDSPLTGIFLERHGLRFEVVPLRLDGTATFNQPVSFAGTTFSPNTSTAGGVLGAATACWKVASIVMMSTISAGSIMDF
jgi:hypothetical protein